MSTQPNQHGPIDLRTVESRPRRFLRITDCAGELGCSRNHVRNLLTAGRIKAYELDGLVLVAAADWDRYLDSAQVKE